MRKARKTKEVTASDPLYSDFVKAEEILDGFKSKENFKFPIEGLGSMETGLLGEVQYVRVMHKMYTIKRTPKRKKTATKKQKTEQNPEQKKGFWSFLK